MELKWVELNPSSDLSKEAQVAYAAYKATYAKAKEARAAFEAIVSKEAQARKVHDDTQRVAFSYNFGRLSVAIAPKEAAKAAKAAPGWAALSA
jgi:hypothetical protein